MGDRIAVVDNRMGASTAGRDRLLGLLSSMVGPPPNTALDPLSIPDTFANSLEVCIEEAANDLLSSLPRQMAF